jgi:hypothetical protein
MNKRDYILIADGITRGYKKYLKNNGKIGMLGCIVLELCDVLKTDNTLFDEDKFKDYILREWQDHQNSINDFLNQKGE